jgi:hypothetical protein
MEKKIISFKGISNVPDDGLNEAGDMSVLLNMRHKGGELVECKKPSEEPAQSVKQALYHAQSDMWLVLLEDGTLLYENRTEGGTFMGKYKSFATMGNIVIMYGEDFVHYAIWRNGAYVFLGKLPHVLGLMATGLDEKKKERITEQKYRQRYDKDNKDLYNRAVQKGFVDEILNSIYEECGYIDRAWFRVGLKLFDGSYIALSGIYQLSARHTGEDSAIGVQPGDTMWFPAVSGEDEVQYKVSVNYFVPKIVVGKISDNWKDIITSIDVFSTGSIMTFMAAKERIERGGILLTDEYEWYRKRSKEELKEAMINAEFYKVAEFSINGELMWKINNTSPSVIAVQKALTQVQVHSIIPQNSYVYNSRLHVSNIKEALFKGYAPAYRLDGKGFGRTENMWTVLVYIDTDNGQRIVKYEETGGAPEDNEDLLYYFMYPDSRATKMEIYRERYNNAGLEVLKLPLTAHRTRNEAYYLQMDSITVSTNEGQDGSGDDMYYKDIPIIKTNYEWEGADKIPEADFVNEYNNILKVSAVDNPFYFPTAQTYKFEGEIKGLASNAEAISTGQFGAYPLFVFTKEGIWAMQTDTSGKGAYLSQAPFSREVCSGAICPVSGGVVFATEKGVMAISGGRVTELSKPLDGLEEMLFNFSGPLAGQIFARAGYDGYEKFEPVPIREYIQGENGNVKGESGAKLAYNYLHNEVILSNVNYGYSYVYSLDNQTWGMIDTKFDITTNSYPELVVYNNQEKKRYTFDDVDTNNVPVVAITRPFVLGSFDYKRLRQAGLRTTFDGQLNFYLLGSNDGANFVCITGKEADTDVVNPDGGTARDLITAMSRSKQYKYFAIAIAGQMSGRGRVSMAELLVDAGFANNQIR